VGLDVAESELDKKFNSLPRITLAHSHSYVERYAHFYNYLNKTQ